MRPCAPLGAAIGETAGGCDGAEKLAQPLRPSASSANRISRNMFALRYSRALRRRNALVTTVTELMLIAAAAMIGLSKMP